VGVGVGLSSGTAVKALLFALAAIALAGVMIGNELIKSVMARKNLMAFLLWVSGGRILPFAVKLNCSKNISAATVRESDMKIDEWKLSN
jgi:hypothetical protein